MEAKSVAFRCCEGGKQIKSFYHGTVQRYEQSRNGEYVPVGKEETVYLCHPIDDECSKCDGLRFFGFCRFTDTDNIVSFHE